jgi:predicted O-methyltransferase YrrM
MKMRRITPAHPVFLFILALSFSPALFAGERTSTKAYNKQYTFTKNTFTDRIPSWTKLLNEFKGKPGINYLEIGTFEGRSALWVLENILTHPTSKLTIIDAFEEHTYNTFLSNINLSGEAAKFTILTGLSTNKIRELPFNSIDFAYVDGSGKGIVMLSDLVSTWNLVKVGGLIICSQYSLNEALRRALGLQPDDPGPHEAIDAFLKIYSSYITVLTLQEGQVVFRKKRSAE